MLPFSFVFLGVFNTLSSKLTRKRLFNTIILAFMVYLAAFAFLIFPNASLFHPHAAADTWLQVLPSGFAGGVAAVRNWTFSVFYCVSEMWGDIGLSLLFWCALCSAARQCAFDVAAGDQWVNFGHCERCAALQEPHTDVSHWLCHGSKALQGLAHSQPAEQRFMPRTFITGPTCLCRTLANETTSIADAAVLYPLFGIGANVAQVFAGQCLKALGAMGANGSGFVPQLQVLTGLMLLLGTAVIALHEYISKSATFRPDTLDSAPELHGKHAPATSASAADSSAVQDGEGHGMEASASVAEAASAHDSGAAQPSTQGSSHCVPDADAASPSNADNGVGWAPSQRPAPEFHLHAGPGVIMQMEVCSSAWMARMCQLGSGGLPGVLRSIFQKLFVVTDEPKWKCIVHSCCHQRTAQHGGVQLKRHMLVSRHALLAAC